MLELVSLLLPTLAGLFRRRHEPVVENLLLRPQPHIARRSRPHPPLKTPDRCFWLLLRRQSLPPNQSWRTFIANHDGYPMAGIDTPVAGIPRWLCPRGLANAAEQSS